MPSSPKAQLEGSVTGMGAARAVLVMLSIASAIEDGSSTRAREAMTAHMQSAIWAIDQVGSLDQRSTARDVGTSAHA